jgi:hypothetical protein
MTYGIIKPLDRSIRRYASSCCFVTFASRKMVSAQFQIRGKRASALDACALFLPLVSAKLLLTVLASWPCSE